MNKKEWKNYFRSVPGTKRESGDGEDRAYAGSGKVNVIAIADGVSGAGPLSAVGAHIITKIAVPFFERKFENIWELPPEKLFTFFSRNLGGLFWAELNNFCRESSLPEILTPRGNINQNIEKYQTTAIVCAVCENRMIFLKFGNGFAIICGEHGAELISASTTEGFGTPNIILLSDPNNSEFEIGRYYLSGDIHSIALFSDGVDYCSEIYDCNKCKVGGGYIRWLESALESEETFRESVLQLAEENYVSKDDVSVAVMFDETAPLVDMIAEKTHLKPLYIPNECEKVPVSEGVKKHILADIRTVRLKKRIHQKITNPREFPEQSTNNSPPTAIGSSDERQIRKEKLDKKKVLAIVIIILCLLFSAAHLFFDIVLMKFISDLNT